MPKLYISKKTSKTVKANCAAAEKIFEEHPHLWSPVDENVIKNKVFEKSGKIVENKEVTEADNSTTTVSAIANEDMNTEAVEDINNENQDSSNEESETEKVEDVKPRTRKRRSTRRKNN